MNGVVSAVSLSPTHTFSKPNARRITLLAGLGVEGDAHMGKTVKHRSRVERDPTQPNLRQVHLIHQELYDELCASGFSVSPGQLGENITTQGLDLLNLPVGTRLRLGNEAVVELTGLRGPCQQLDGLQPGLLKAVFDRTSDGPPKPKSGVMGIVLHTGAVHPGDDITVELPAEPRRPMEKI